MGPEINKKVIMAFEHRTPIREVNKWVTQVGKHLTAILVKRRIQEERKNGISSGWNFCHGNIHATSYTLIFRLKWSLAVGYFQTDTIPLPIFFHIKKRVPRVSLLVQRNTPAKLQHSGSARKDFR